MMRERFAALLSLPLVTVSLFVRGSAQEVVPEADAVVGTWRTSEGKAIVEIFKCEESYCGRIVWLREPLKEGKPVLDDKNPDETLRERPVLGMVLLHGFVYDEDYLWTGGTVYDPESGDAYSARMTLVGEEELELRGYVLIPLFGRTETWTRVEGLPDPEDQPAYTD